MCWTVAAFLTAAAARHSVIEDRARSFARCQYTEPVSAPQDFSTDPILVKAYLDAARTTHMRLCMRSDGFELGGRSDTCRNPTALQELCYLPTNGLWAALVKIGS